MTRERELREDDVDKGGRRSLAGVMGGVIVGDEGVRRIGGMV